MASTSSNSSSDPIIPELPDLSDLSVVTDANNDGDTQTMFNLLMEAGREYGKINLTYATNILLVQLGIRPIFRVTSPKINSEAKYEEVVGQYPELFTNIDIIGVPHSRDRNRSEDIYVYNYNLVPLEESDHDDIDAGKPPAALIYKIKHNRDAIKAGHNRFAEFLVDKVGASRRPSTLYTYGYNFRGPEDRTTLEQERLKLEKVLSVLGLYVQLVVSCKPLHRSTVRLFQPGYERNPVGGLRKSTKPLSKDMLDHAASSLYRRLDDIVKLTAKHGFVGISAMLSEATDINHVLAVIINVGDKAMHVMFNTIQSDMEAADPFLEGISVSEDRVKSNGLLEAMLLNKESVSKESVEKC